MGVCQSKPDIIHPATIAGSTVINGHSVMILDGRFLIPASDTNSGESSVIEVDMKNRRVQILRGVEGRMTNAFINSTRRKKEYNKAFAEVKSNDDEYESQGLQGSPEGSTISCHEKRETSFIL